MSTIYLVKKNNIINVHQDKSCSERDGVSQAMNMSGEASNFGEILNMLNKENKDHIKKCNNCWKNNL